MSMDAAGLWRSRDNGDTWEKPEQAGLFETWGESIKVDPIDPDIVFFVVHQGSGGSLEDYEGLYKSTDGGDTWAFVLNIESDDKHEAIESNIDYDPTSIGASEGMSPLSLVYTVLKMVEILGCRTQPGLIWEIYPVCTR